MVGGLHGETAQRLAHCSLAGVEPLAGDGVLPLGLGFAGLGGDEAAFCIGDAAPAGCGGQLGGSRVPSAGGGVDVLAEQPVFVAVGGDLGVE
ncbi:MAG: hypothetical protein KDB17_13910, partial [Ilumatobacter sp.]|nr:hypothetical protein [Ilumatobacter sp.]